MVSLFIVVPEMSAGNNTKDRQKLSETEVKLTYCLTESQRQSVNAIRNKYRNRIVRNNSINVHSLLVCNGDQKKIIEQDIEEADNEMKELAACIHKDIEMSYGMADTPEIQKMIEEIKVPNLHASVRFFPLDAAEIKKGEVYSEIANEIKAKVFSEIIGRLSPILDMPDGQVVPTRTKAAWKKLIVRLQMLNILEDDEIKDSIKKADELFDRDSLVPLKDFLLENGLDLKPVGGRAAAVEI
jgi:hypothetical protein